MERRIVINDGETQHRITVDDNGTVIVDGTSVPVIGGPDGEVRIGENGTVRAWVAASGDIRWVYLGGRVYELDVERAGRRRRSSSGPSSLSAPMPATVIRVEVSPGEQVQRGDTLVILEAMKMELPIRAASDGTVASVSCKPGDLVQPGMPLIEIE
jgi:acetyl/propionyl-CoA carboxylase alpha subunit